MSKHILFLTPQLPFPPHQGTAIRNFGLIEGLARRGQRITLLSFLEPGQPLPGQTPLAGLCEKIVTVPAPAPRTIRQRLSDLLAGRPDMARRRWSPDFLDALRRLLADSLFDAVHFEGLEMAVYLQEVRAAAAGRKPDTLLIYDAHNAEYALQQRIARQDLQSLRRLPLALYSAVQASRLKRLEAQAVLAAGQVLVCSETDAAQIGQLGASTPVTVIPNAINTAQYRVAGGGEAAIIHPALVFTGKMDFRPNVDAVLWFGLHILPLIRQSVPEAHFTIVGQKPHTRLGALRGLPGITLTGFVPEIQPYLAAADVYVAPLRMGSGTRLKLLEAMAMERAIVSTRLGAEGLAVEDGEHLLFADTPEDFAKAVTALLQDPEHRQMLGQKAARLAREQYDWTVVIPRLEAVYTDQK